MTGLLPTWCVGWIVCPARRDLMLTGSVFQLPSVTTPR